MNDPYPRTQPNIIATGMTIARCAKCRHQWMFDHKPDGYEATTRWCPTYIPDVLPVMGNRGAA